MSRLKESPIEPDQCYFEQLVARTILFKQTKKLVSSQKYGGYRANIVTYTIAWLCMDAEKREKQLDLSRIWQNQRLSPEVEQAIITVSQSVFASITHPPGNANITEWCKREACWKTILDIATDLPEAYYAQLISLLPPQPEEPSGKAVKKRKLIGPEAESMERIQRLDKMTWYMILQKNRDDHFLSKEQEQLAVGLMSHKPKVDEIQMAISILEECKRLGWTVG